jgi:hypothetical protein
VAVYEGIELMEIYRIEPRDLEALFQAWEQRIERQGPLNNPKIPMRVVRGSQRVFPPAEDSQ